MRFLILWGITMMAAKAFSSGFILTGGPGVGKTSIAIALEKQGEIVVHETAIDIIKYYLANGQSTPWLNEGFQEEIAKLQEQRESFMISKLNGRRFFLDRTAFDCLAYKLVAEKLPSAELIETILSIDSSQYSPIVFVIKGSGVIEQTDYRDESPEESKRIEEALLYVYRSLGFRTIMVEYGPLQQRVDFILRIASMTTPADLMSPEVLHENLKKASWRKNQCHEAVGAELSF